MHKNGNVFYRGTNPNSGIILMIGKTGLFAFLLLCILATGCIAGDITLVAVGDVMLGRYVNQKYGSGIKLGEIGKLLRDADIAFGNLEACVGDGSGAYQAKKILLSVPAKSGTRLREMGFKVLSIANNHCADFGPDAITRTQKILAENGMGSFGAGVNEVEARKPHILAVGGLRIGFLGYDADSARGSGQLVAPLELAVIADDLAALRPKVDFVIVSFHWGKEYSEHPGIEQEKIAHRTIDLGADLVLGHHPHVLQRIESYKGKLIAYSLGNFIFDQLDPKTSRSMILRVTISSRKVAAVQVYPIFLERYLPRVPSAAQAQAIIKKLKFLSVKSLAGKSWTVSWKSWG
jgi:poly-gamma-glutamate synthesis protein (capsule biosynthesis protein)